jgi:hypothetical protein
MSTKIDKDLVAAKMYIEGGFIDEPVEGDLNLALFGDPDARLRIDEAMARYRYAEKEGSGELSTSGLSTAELIADPATRDLAKQAAIHGTIQQFLRNSNITGRPEQMSASAASLGEKLVAKHCLSEKVLKGIAKAADAASARMNEALQAAGILVTTYGELLSRLIAGHFHPAQARAILDEFFSWRAFNVLSRMRSFNSPRWKRIKDGEKLGALAVYILDQFNMDEINNMANELTDRMAKDPVYGDLSDWERSELAHYASVQRDPEKAMGVIGRLYNSQLRVEEGYNDTAFDDVAKDISRIAQFASDEKDAFRVADLMISDATNLFRFTIGDIDDAHAMRLSILAKIYASRMGITNTKTLVANLSDNFKSLLKRIDRQSRPEMELAFKASFSPDENTARKTFIRSKTILESASMDIEDFELKDDDRDQALMAVVREMSLRDLENLQMALDLAKTSARQAAQKMLAGTTPTEAPATVEEEQIFAPPVRASEAPKLIMPVRPKPLQTTAKPKPSESISPSHSFSLKRSLMEKFNFGSAFIDEATTRMAETRNFIKIRSALLAMINIAVQSLKSDFGIKPSVAFAMLEERMLGNTDRYFERITALPFDDQAALERAIGELSIELNTDVAENSLEGHDVKVREVAIRLSKWIDAEDAVHMAATLAPFVVDDSDCRRVVENYMAVLAHLKGTINEGAARQIAKGVRLEGNAESAVESAKRYTRELANVRSKPQLKGMDPGLIAKIFNLALGMRIGYELAALRAAEIAGTYMDVLRTLGMSGIWHGGEELSLLVSSYEEPSEPLDFVLEAYGEVVGYLESKSLRKDVEGRLAAVICKRVLDMKRSHSGGSARIMRIHAAQYFDIYKDIYNDLMYGGLEEGLAIDRALALTSVYDESRTPFMVRQEIAKHSKLDGDDEGPGSGSAPVAGGAPQGTPTPPVSGGTQAKGSFAGIVREEAEAAPSDEFLVEAWIVDENSMFFPGAANQTAMILGARVALTASTL